MIPALLVPSVRPIVAIYPVAPITGSISATTQLSLRQYLIGGGFTDVSASAGWSTSDATVATVSAGLVTLTGFGSATITATYLGKSYTITAGANAKDTFITKVRAAVVGGDSKILAMHNVIDPALVDDGAGHVNAAGLPDLRGAGYAPAMTPSGAGGPLIVGTGTSRVLRTSGGRGLESILTSLYQQTTITLVWAGVSTKNDNDYPVYIQCAALGDGYTGVNIGTNGSGETGFMNAFYQPGPHTLYNARHQSSKVRSYSVHRSTTTGKVRGGLLNAITGVIESPSAATPAKLGIGTAAGATLNTTADTAVILAIDHDMTDAEWDGINAAIYLCNAGATGSPSVGTIHGDSYIRGHGLNPQTLGWAARVADALAPTINIEIYGTDGIPISSVVATPNLAGERAAVIDPIFTHGQTKKLYVAAGGINDLRAGRTGAQVWADQQARLTAARAATAGLKTAVPTLPPCTANGLGISQATLDAQILIYNNLARAGEGIDYTTGGLIDFRTLTGILDANASAYTDGTLFIEAPIGIHPTDPLSLAMANYAAPKIQALFA